MSRRDGSGAPVDRVRRSVRAPCAGVDRALEMAAELGMRGGDRSDGSAYAGGHRLAGPFDGIADQAAATAEPEVTCEGLGEQLSLLPHERGALTVTHGLRTGFLVVELVKPVPDLTARAVVERSRTANGRRA